MFKLFLSGALAAVIVAGPASAMTQEEKDAINDGITRDERGITWQTSGKTLAVDTDAKKTTSDTSNTTNPRE